MGSGDIRTELEKMAAIDLADGVAKAPGALIKNAGTGGAEALDRYGSGRVEGAHRKAPGFLGIGPGLVKTPAA